MTGVNTAGNSSRGPRSKKRGGWYDKGFAYYLSHSRGKEMYEERTSSIKKSLFQDLHKMEAKNVLELGVGCGNNFKYYMDAQSMHVSGLDPNPAMGYYAETNARNNGLGSFRFIEGSGDNIPAEDNTFDAVVSTLVLCSVKDISSVLNEIKRVVKPGGSYVFVEHVAAPKGSIKLVAQKLLTPLQRVVADGCHLDRSILNYINAAGFTHVEASQFDLKGLGLESPHVAGIATI